MKTPEENRDFKGVWIPRKIYLDKSISWIQKILLVEIHSLDKGEGCFASNEYLAAFVQVKERTCANLISDLRKKGYIIDRLFDGRRRYISVEPSLWNEGSFPEYGKADLPKSGKQTSRKNEHIYTVSNTPNNTSKKREEAEPNSAPCFKDVTTGDKVEERESLPPSEKKGLKGTDLEAIQWVDKLAELTGANLKPYDFEKDKPAKYLSKVRLRIKEHGLPLMLEMLEFKVKEWKPSAKMKKHLTVYTLCAEENTAKYMQQMEMERPKEEQMPQLQKSSFLESINSLYGTDYGK